MYNIEFYKNRRVLITGHSGFKGSWMCQLLIMAGAQVTGYALDAPTDPNLFDMCRIAEKINSITGDVRDLTHMKKIFSQAQPEIVIHMAAQPIVKTSYQDPVYTYETNVIGTVNVLECIRSTPSVKSFLNVTTDKVYLNREWEWEWGYRENEELNGYDPYSNSKSCSELVTSSYKNSFFSDSDVAISTARAGNVIGGGDFAADRIIPDCVRAAARKEDVIIRNPFSTRPYEHVLEPITAYLMIAEKQYNNKKYAGSYNVGPDDTNCWSTGKLANMFCEKWNQTTGAQMKWINQHDGGPHEANFLKLDCSKIKQTFGWKPNWDIETAIEKIVEWTAIYFRNGNVADCMKKQIEEFLKTA